MFCPGNHTCLDIGDATFQLLSMAKNGPALELSIEHQRRDADRLEADHPEPVDRLQDLVVLLRAERGHRFTNIGPDPLVAGIVTFVAVGLGLTEVLDPYIWLAALVGLPVGEIVGVAVAILRYNVLTTRGRHRRYGDESSGAV